VCAVVCLGGASVNVLANRNPQVILPPRTIRAAQAWATNAAYAQGDIVQNSRKRLYMALTPGHSTRSGTNEPTHSIGMWDTQTNLTWYAIPAGLRKGAAVVNDSTGTVYVCIGGIAHTNEGIRLNAGGGSVTIGALEQELISVVVHGSNCNVTANEWGTSK
jgi:hypothetical protein